MKEVIYCQNGRNRIYGELCWPAGDGPFPLLIYSHGYGYTRSEISFSRLAQSGIAVYGYDLPGGSPGSRSDGSSLEMSVMTQADALEAVLDTLKNDARTDGHRIWLSGNSQGGFVSTVTGIRCQADISGLFLLCPAYVIQNFRELYLNVEEVPDRFQFGNMMLSRRYIEDLNGYDVYREMRTFSRPVYIYHGTEDDMVPVSWSERAWESFPDAKLTLCPGAGHILSFSGYGEQIENDMIKIISAN